MNHSENIDLLTSFKQLLAINKSQQCRIEEYEKIISSRNREIEMLQSMLSDANAYRSSADNQLKELNDLQSYLNSMKSTGGLTALVNQAPRDLNIAAPDPQQYQKLKQSYSMLQSSYDILQSRVNELEEQQDLSEQQQARIRELEELLFKQPSMDGSNSVGSNGLRSS